MLKIIKIGKKNITVDDTLSRDAGRMFKLLLCREYKRKNGAYPKIVNGTSLLHSELIEGDASAVQRGKHPLEHWDRIRFDQCFKLPETFNLSMIVADKAISPTKSELIQAIKIKGSVMDPEKKRGVIRWLEDKTRDPIHFLTDISNGIFDKEHLCIGLSPKERELNPVPRMFTLMAHLLRVYVVV